MDISVVILTYNEEDNIEDCLGAILKQEYSEGLWEVLVVDGNSTDDTIKIVQNKKIHSKRIKLIINPKKKIAPGRNLGINMSQYPFIAFTDADCIVPCDWLKRLSKKYEDISQVDSKITGVGSGNVPPSQLSRFHQALGIYLNSFLGSFNSPQGRNFSQIKRVYSLSCSNVLYNKKILTEVGGFDNNLGNIGEDLDINLRLRKCGYNLYFIPDASVIHKLRPNLSSWLKNMALYGRGRAIVSFKHKFFLTTFFILPVGFIISMFLIPFGFIKPLFFLPFVYFPTLCFYVLVISIKKKKVLLFGRILSIFILTHFVYAFNLLYKSLQICLDKIKNYIK